MKTIAITITLSLIFGVSAWAQKAPGKVANGHQIEIKTSAVCEMCKETLEQDLTFEKGVKSVNLDVDTKVLTIVYNNKKTDPTALRKRVTLVGYHADSLQRDPKAYQNLPFCCKDGAHDGDND